VQTLVDEADRNAEARRRLEHLLQLIALLHARLGVVQRALECRHELGSSDACLVEAFDHIGTCVRREGHRDLLLSIHLPKQVRHALLDRQPGVHPRPLRQFLRRRSFDRQ
jgi:hypothetical protein